MPRFSQRSINNLVSCHPKLQSLFLDIVKDFDCTVIEGHRDKETQNEYFRTGKSKLEYPNSKHNSYLSLAVDVAPYNQIEKRIRWEHHEDFIYFGGYVLGRADALGIKLRWGGDFDMNNVPKEKGHFFDAVHFELID